MNYYEDDKRLIPFEQVSRLRLLNRGEGHHQLQITVVFKGGACLDILNVDMNKKADRFMKEYKSYLDKEDLPATLNRLAKEAEE